jgi:hypothetical protein
VLVVDAIGRRAAGRDAFRAETAPLDPLRAAAAVDPRFELRRRHRFRGAGWRLRVHVPRAAPAIAAPPGDPIH